MTYVENISTTAIEEPQKITEGHIEVTLTTYHTREQRHFNNYQAFITEWRFHHNGGEESRYADGDEAKFNSIRNHLIKENDHGDSIKTTRSGLEIEMTFYRWNEYDRYMNRI